MATYLTTTPSVDLAEDVRDQGLDLPVKVLIFRAAYTLLRTRRESKFTLVDISCIVPCGPLTPRSGS